MSMTESKKSNGPIPTVYVLQELPGTKAGAPKINIMSASQHGNFKFLFLLGFFHIAKSEKSLLVS